MIEWHIDAPNLYSVIEEHLGRQEYSEGISYSQFLNIFTTELTRNQTREDITNMFKLVDIDEKGAIKLDDLKRLVKEIGESVTLDELRELIKNCTSNNDEIPFEEFYNIFKRPTT